MTMVGLPVHDFGKLPKNFLCLQFLIYKMGITVAPYKHIYKYRKQWHYKHSLLIVSVHHVSYDFYYLDSVM